MLYDATPLSLGEGAALLARGRPRDFVSDAFAHGVRAYSEAATTLGEGGRAGRMAGSWL